MNVKKKGPSCGKANHGQFDRKIVLENLRTRIAEYGIPRCEQGTGNGKFHVELYSHSGIQGEFLTAQLPPCLSMGLKNGRNWRDAS